MTKRNFTHILTVEENLEANHIIDFLEKTNVVTKEEKQWIFIEKLHKLLKNNSKAFEVYTNADTNFQ